MTKPGGGCHLTVEEPRRVCVCSLFNRGFERSCGSKVVATVHDHKKINSEQLKIQTMIYFSAINLGCSLLASQVPSEFAGCRWSTRKLDRTIDSENGTMFIKQIKKNFNYAALKRFQWNPANCIKSVSHTRHCWVMEPDQFDSPNCVQDKRAFYLLKLSEYRRSPCRSVLLFLIRPGSRPIFGT